MIRKLKNCLALIGTVACAAGFMPSAFAQGAGPAPGPGARPAMMPEGPSPLDLKLMAEHRLLNLHAVLKLRSDQEPAWNEFRQALLTQAEQMQGKMKQAREVAKASAVERLEWMVKGSDDRKAALTAVLAATKKFYPALDAEQKVRFDKAFHLTRGRHGRHGHGHHGAPGGPGGGHPGMMGHPGAGPGPMPPVPGAGGPGKQ